MNTLINLFILIYYAHSTNQVAEPQPGHHNHNLGTTSAFAQSLAIKNQLDLLGNFRRRHQAVSSGCASRNCC